MSIAGEWLILIGQMRVNSLFRPSFIFVILTLLHLPILSLHRLLHCSAQLPRPTEYAFTQNQQKYTKAEVLKPLLPLHTIPSSSFLLLSPSSFLNQSFPPHVLPHRLSLQNSSSLFVSGSRPNPRRSHPINLLLFFFLIHRFL